MTRSFDPAPLVRWRRRGRIVAPGAGDGWWRSHAQCPTPIVLEDGLWRLYFGGRDADNRSRIVFVDVDPEALMKIERWGLEPALELGGPGAFDSHGQGPSWAGVWNGRVQLYYVGVHLKRDAPYGLSVGLAQSEDGARFHRACPGPVMGTGPDDPYFSSLAFIEPEAQTRWRAWYMRGRGWEPGEDGGYDPVYDLGCARSQDGRVWISEPDLGLALEGGAAGLARPWIVETAGRRFLFFSERGGGAFRAPGPAAYRLAVVEIDAKDRRLGPKRDLEYVNPPGASDWDSWMQAYAAVVPWRDGWALFYSGDDFGRAGFGWASWEPEG